MDRYSLLKKGDRVIVGVSAGVDSMVLLHLLNALRPNLSLTLIVAHLNHGLRPEEAEREAELVHQESLRLGLPFEYKEFNAKEFHSLQGISLQDAARRGRFQFFHDLLQRYGGGKIALGHHADDQVETLLLRLLRGSGLQGLKGMVPIREGYVIRPLLEVWKEEIESFAKEKSIPHLIDSSNLKTNYLRNRLRLNLLPLIEREYQKGFRRAAFRTSTLLREENDFLDQEAERAYGEITYEERDTLHFELKEFQSLHPALQWRVIQKALERMKGESNLSEGEWREANWVYHLLRQPPSSFLLELPRGLYLEKRYDTILVKRGKPEPIPPFEVELLVPGTTHLQEIGKEIFIEEKTWASSDKIDDHRNVAFLDYGKLQFPLRMRNFRPGDRFQPLGSQGMQKVKEFFIDRKIPRFERPSIPLLLSGERIAWVVGHRIDERFKVTSSTRKVLRIELLQP